MAKVMEGGKVVAAPVAAELCLAKLYDEKQEKEARSAVVAGVYPVDFSVNVKGLVTVGEDYDAEVPAKALPWKLLAVLASKVNGETLKSVLAEYREAAERHINGEPFAFEALEDEIKRKAERALDGLKSATLTRCKGKVTLSLEKLELYDMTDEPR